MENLVKETEVAIIGAGYGGLTAAALLARKGIRAEVFECLSVPGGRARSTERDGFTLDHGVHGYRCADDSAGARVLRELGETIKWVPEHGNRAMLVTGGKRFVYPQKVADIFRLPLLSPGDALRFTLILLKILTVPVSMIADTSFAQFAGRASKRPQVRTMLQALGLAAMAPDIDQASAGEVVHLLRRGIRARQGIGHPLGGEKQVIDKLIRHIIDPVRLNLKNGVRKIHISDKRVEAVETENGIWKPKAVLFAMPVQRLFRFVDPKHFRPEFHNYALNLEPTCGISVDLALAEPVSDEGGSILDLEQFLMGRFPSVSDPSLCPPGRQLATWLWVVNSLKMRDKNFIRGVREQMRNKIEQLAPGTMGKVMWERWLYFSILDGVYLRVGQAWQNRPPLRSQDVENLFFAGDTARAPGVGGEIAFLSALNAVPLIEKFRAGDK